jgi:hypothetical protein
VIGTTVSEDDILGESTRESETTTVLQAFDDFVAFSEARLAT